MRKPAFRKSHRQTLTDNQKALDDMAQMSGKPRVVLYVPTPVAPRAKAGSDGRPLEKEIQAAVLQFLRAHPKVQWAHRFNSGTAMSGDERGNVRYTKFNTCKGFSDIHFLLKGGRAGYCEVKRDRMQPTDDQSDFLAACAEAGALAFVARSIEDVANQLARA